MGILRKGKLMGAGHENNKTIKKKVFNAPVNARKGDHHALCISEASHE